MDDLAAAMAGSFSVSNVANNTAAEHPRFSQYKQRGHETSQEKRRRQILQSQKNSRYDFMLHVRRLAENVWDDMSMDDGKSSQSAKSQHNSASGNSPTQQKFNKYDSDFDDFRPGRYYKDQLMLSEWMVDVPENFASDWLLVPCPVGKRNLVIASGGGTTSYSKSGWKIQSFPSKLPGGSKSVPGWKKDVTILDTLYNELTKTYYVLDIMCWKEMPLYETETEFRFFWLHNKLGELGASITTINKGNPYRFEPLPNFSCETDNIERLLQTDMKLKLDGLLFYHKKSHYLCTTTPVVLWLKAYMLPDILGVPVPPHLLKEKPASYTSFDAHKLKVKEDKEKEEKKAKERQEKRRSRTRDKNGENKMDVAVSGEQEETQKSTGKEHTGSEDTGEMEAVEGKAAASVD